MPLLSGAGVGGGVKLPYCREFGLRVVLKISSSDWSRMRGQGESKNSRPGNSASLDRGIQQIDATAPVN